jgi:hypothetical protein
LLIKAKTNAVHLRTGPLDELVLASLYVEKHRQFCRCHGRTPEPGGAIVEFVALVAILWQEVQVPRFS